MSQTIQNAGGRPINIRTFDNFAIAFQALRAGQVEAVTSIDAVAAEFDQRGEFPRVLHGINATPAALAFRSRALAQEVAKVFAEMTADGSLKALFDRYGVGIAEGNFALAGPQ
jgi:polar amino acid transport system substrate-binding protein